MDKIGVGIGIAIAIAIEVGALKRPMAIAIPIEIPMPIPTPFMRLRHCASQRKTKISFMNSSVSSVFLRFLSSLRFSFEFLCS